MLGLDGKPLQNGTLAGRYANEPFSGLESVIGDLSCEDYTRLPVFARHVLGLPLYPKQEAVLADLDPIGAQVSACCANGIGKTTMLAAAPVLWHPIMYPRSVTVTSSGVFRQVKEQMWPRIRELARRFNFLGIDPNQTEFTVQHSSGESRVVGFSTDDPGKFEGWHGDSLLIVLDECKTIPDEIAEAVERCKQGQPVRVLLLSSPGPSKGFFYRSQTSEKRFWKTHKITASDCPHISQQSLDALIAKWGREHPLVKSMVDAEFMDIGAETLVISTAKYEHCLANRPMRKGVDRAAFCDFAAGGDENVFAYREGNQIIDVTPWIEKNTMAAVGRFLQLFRRYNLQPEDVYGDGSGLGIPMCDAMAEAGFPIHRVNNGSAAYDDREFMNRGAELWYTAARVIERAEVALPKDDILQQQCTSRRVKTDHKGRLGVESKPDMAKRGLQSPDRADAVLGVIACKGVASDILTQFTGRRPLEMLQVLQDEREYAGWDPGY